VALELGFPFSDPIADGPVLEAAHERALQHGTTWADLLAACRTVSPLLPTAVMTYANPVWHRGIDRALHDLDVTGASGLIVPDLSLGSRLRSSQPNSGITSRSSSWQLRASTPDGSGASHAPPGASSTSWHATGRRAPAAGDPRSIFARS
jgi:hypothetical protein